MLTHDFSPCRLHWATVGCCLSGAGTASSTPCWKKLLEVSLPFLALILTLASAPLSVRAAGIQVESAELKLQRERYDVYAHLAIKLNPTLEEALHKGVTLVFRTDFRIVEPRRWWFDAELAHEAMQSRLSYNFLLRRYLLESGYQTHAYDTLDGALDGLGDIRAWSVLDRGELRPGATYRASLRMKLDTSQLSKPMQVNALASGKWSLESPWYGWRVEAAAP